MSEPTYTAEQVRRLMLKGWEYGWEAHEAFVECCPDVARNAHEGISGSNRRSVALGDVPNAEGAQNDPRRTSIWNGEAEEVITVDEVER